MYAQVLIRPRVRAMLSVLILARILCYLAEHSLFGGRCLKFNADEMDSGYRQNVSGGEGDTNLKNGVLHLISRSAEYRSVDLQQSTTKHCFVFILKYRP